MTGTDVAKKDRASHEIVVWDWSVRLFHAALILLLPALWWTAEKGQFTWHLILGVSTLALLVFRVAWGFVGSTTARFNNFVRGPQAVAAYALSKTEAEAKGAPLVGHNPLGGWSVLAMLALLICQAALGLVAGDPDDSAVGPLNHLVSFTTADAATELHELVFNVILALVGLHVVAVLGYRLLKSENLIRPMVTGRKSYPGPVAQPAIAPTLRALSCAALAAGLAYWLHAGAPLS